MQPTTESLTLLDRRPRDDAWAAAVRESPEATRAALLHAADGGRDGPDAATALDVLRALADELPFEGADAEARLLWMIERSRPVDSILEAVCRRSVHQARSRDLRVRAGLRLGRLRDYAGDTREARAFLQAALEEVRGDGSQLEAAALYNVGRVEILSGRWLEALVALERAAGLADAGERSAAIVVVRTALVEVCTRLGDVGGARDHLLRIRSAIQAVEASRRGAMGRQLRAAEADVAAAEGRWADVVDRLGEMPDPDRDAAALWRRSMLARAHARLGQSDVALQHIARADEVTDAAGTVRARLESERIHCLTLAGDRESAFERAERLLCDLEARVRDGSGPYVAVCVAAELAHTLEQAESGHELILRAYDVAATGAVARLVQIHQFVAGPAAVDDEVIARVLRRTERSWIDEHDQLLDRVAEALRRAAESTDVAGLAPFVDADSFVHACAWCRRVRTEPGRPWLPIGEFLARAEFIRVSHGICPSCSADVRGRLGL